MMPERDARDPLAPPRPVRPARRRYLSGWQLSGRPPARCPARAQQVIAQEWGHDLIRSWNTAGWFDLPKRLGNRWRR
jgi:kynureninase